ncbi:MAG: AraC family transcriptional regulator [Planctomycetota bacterium]
MQPLAHLRRLNFAVPYVATPGQNLGNDQVRLGQERIELVTKGRGWVQHENDWVEVTAGSLVWNIAGDWTIGRYDIDDPFQCLAMDFYVSSTAQRTAPRFSRWEDPAEITAFAQQIGRMIANERVDKSVLGTFIYAHLLLQAQVWEQRDRHRPLAPQLRQIVSILDGRYAEELDLAKLAKDAGLSLSHMHATFRRHFATSPHQYLLKRRVQAVCAALMQRHHGLADIAHATGFTSAQALIRAFRRDMGITPMQWRARHGARSR